MPRPLRCVPLLLLCLAGCLEAPDKQAKLKHRQLYVRLGGEEGIARIVDAFVADAAKNDRIPTKHRKLFQEGDVAELKGKLVKRIAEASARPAKADDRTGRDATQGAAKVDKEADALADSFRRALEQNQVDEQDRKELLRVLGPIKDLLPELN
jgi:truncated hemoglobin YjbI